MKIEELRVSEILDSRGESTIEFGITTPHGTFIGSSPSGKSTGKYEAPTYRNGLVGDIQAIKAKEAAIKELYFNHFIDLAKLELLLKRDVGANTLIALESAILKAMAAEQKKQVWQILNANAKRLPIPVVNIIGGGKHTKESRKPDFQEFLVIPNAESLIENKRVVKEIYNKLPWKLRFRDKKLFINKNDEGAYNTKMANNEVLAFLSEFDIKLGLDVAASSFYKTENYLYNNPLKVMGREEQIKSIINTIKNFKLFYVEDPVEEEDYEGFAEIKKETDCLIVGDDLIATHPERLKKSIMENSINAVIVKPNQSGSLLEVKKIVEIAKAHDLKIVFSHRSGETQDSILADLAFAFESDYIKISLGEGDSTKWQRLEGIERFLKGEVTEEQAVQQEEVLDLRLTKEEAKVLEQPVKPVTSASIEIKEERQNFKEKVASEMKDREKHIDYFKDKYGKKGINSKLEDKDKYKYSFERKK